MKKYNVVLDTKLTIWHRTTATVEANSLEEAQKKLAEYHDGSSDLDPNEVETEYLYGTVEPLSVVENYAAANIDILMPDYENVLTSEDKETNKVQDFPEELNYEI